MGKELVAHGLDQGLRRFGVVHPEEVITGHLNHSHQHDGRRHDPQVPAEIGEAADGINQVHDEGRKVALLTAQGAVHRGADDLGLEHVRQGRDAGGENGDGEVPLCALQKLQQKRQLPGSCFMG